MDGNEDRLYYTACSDHVVLILCIIFLETVINLQDEEGFTPLMWAAAHGQIAVVEFLLQNVRKRQLGVLVRYHGVIVLEHVLLIHSLVLILCHSPL